MSPAEEGDRHRRARGAIIPGRWLRWRPILGFALAVLFGAILLCSLTWLFQWAGQANKGTWISTGPAVRR